MKKQHNIILADDHIMFLEGLHTIISEIPEIGDIHLATEGQQVIRLMKQFPIDLIISDINMPKMDGLTLLAEAKKQMPEVKFMILSMLDDARTVQKVIQRNADGFVLKMADKKELKKAVQEVLKGEKYYSEVVKKTYMESVFERKKHQHVELSQREKEVLKLLSEELTSKEISERFFISVNTVETHRKNILLKTGSKTTVGAVKFAIENGFLDD
ncbi:response regulator transcription factor [Fulvivirga ulvae]|uniref:response regulator transcription factor n=1 Tax=Fulvivirga ulvae TaxID=2904245 RepID=UPI001F48CE19|nr:response regulator transcription factor [Fulvivirga ulvae]UII32854.1 response regulator transcription factor [Fulvivirga ulvae]